MDTKVLIQSFTEFAKQKNVDRPTMIRILQDVFRAMIKKKYEHDENFDIVINADKGDLEIMRFREIVDDNSEDIWDFDKIKLSDAKKIEKDFEIGDEVAEEIKIEDFGRRAIILAKQTLVQRVKDLEKEVVINNIDKIKINENKLCFHAGTNFKDNQTLAIGGRVLNFVSLSNDFLDARKKILDNLKFLNWKKGFYRKDIGYKVID